VPAATYAERARVAAALMKGLDPTIETVVCGSSSRWLPTWLEWDRIVLEHCWDEVDYVATHRYSGNRHDDTRSFLAEGVVIDEHLEGYRGLLGFLRARRRSPHRVHVAFDEWNVWYRETNPDGGWREAPPLLEEVYTLEDALVCAQYLHAFIRHADLVRIACLAQLVNVIAPLLVRPEGVLTQTIAWPFRMLRTAGGAEALRPVVAAPEMPTRRGDVPVGDAVAVRGDDGGVLVSIVLRDPDREAEVRVALEGFGPLRLDRARVLTGDPRDANTWETPGRVAPRPLEVEVTPGPGGRTELQLRLPGPAHAVAELVPAGLRSGGR
jgi:alpha-N-arabinofuranosidase